MIVLYSQIKNSSLLSLDEQKNLGQVFDLVLQKSDMSIKGFLARTNSLLPTKKTVSKADIIEISNNAVVVRDDSALVDLDELPQIKQAIKSKLVGINQKVVTKSGKKIGNVYDYTIDSQSMLLTSIYIKSMFSDRIISRTAIISLEGKKITIDDDFEVIKNAQAVPEAA